jgi:hypothetical protein
VYNQLYFNNGLKQHDLADYADFYENYENVLKSKILSSEQESNIAHYKWHLQSM